jgi:hypothetical protein
MTLSAPAEPVAQRILGRSAAVPAAFLKAGKMLALREA